MRIVLVNGERGFAGGEVQLFYLLDHLRQKGDECLLVGREDSKAVARARSLGVSTFELPMRNGVDVSSILRMRSLFIRLDPDVIHMHTHRAHVLGAFAALRLSKPARVVTRRMDYPIPRTPLHRLLYGKLVDAVVSISGAVTIELHRLGIPSHRIVTIPSGVDVEAFRPSDDDHGLARKRARRALSLPDDSVIFGTAANLHPRKGLDVLIRAFARFDRQGRDTHLAIAGSGSSETDIRDLVSSLGLDQNVTLLGQLDDVRELLDALDVFCLPSRKEGLGVSVLEAMASGLPVVASRVGGLAESVRHGSTGLLVEPGDVSELEAALTTLLHGDALRAELGSRGRERVCAHYSAEAMARQNRELYASLMSARRADSGSPRRETRT